MKTLKLLIIEDEDSQLTIYQDTIEQHNKATNINIEYTICKDFESGKAILLSPDFDAAIIDLKLSTKIELEGIQLVEAVYKKIRIPIFVVSGSIPQINHISENALFKKRKRTEIFSDIIDEMIGIYNTGITSFLRPSGIIDQKLTEIFWNNLATDLHIWIDKNNETTLLRYIFSHFQEHLNINTDGDFEEYDPSEVYIKPPIKRNIHTGDIIKVEDQYYLILTPACDIVIHSYKIEEGGNKNPQRKAEKMMLVLLKEFIPDNLCKNTKGVLDKNKIAEYVNNKQFRFHYLPPLQENNGFLIDFQDLKSVYCNIPLERIASISSPFIKDIISRFSNYYARQGQPTFGQNKIIDTLSTVK